MRIPWRWVPPLIYLVATLILAWQREYVLLQLLSGVGLTLQGGWVLWRHYRQQELKPTSQLRWTGWMPAMSGLVVLGLTSFAVHLQAAERQAANVWVRCGTDWPTVLRPASECPPEERRR